MGKPQFPFGEEITVFACGKAIKCTVVDVGNKHCVITGKADMKVAATLQRNGIFDNGVNVEFVTVTVDGLNVRVYERGSGETLSCGSGACAAVAACVRKNSLSRARRKYDLGEERFSSITAILSCSAAKRLKFSRENIFVKSAFVHCFS